jgi:hypothetical protein
VGDVGGEVTGGGCCSNFSLEGMCGRRRALMSSRGVGQPYSKVVSPFLLLVIV